MFKARVQRFDEETRETTVENVLASLARAQRNAKTRLVSEEEVRYVLQRFTASPGEVRGYRFHGGNVPGAYRYPAETTIGELAGWYPGFLVYAFHRCPARRTVYGRTTEGEAGWMHPLNAARTIGPHLVNQDLTAHRAKLTAVHGDLPEDVFVEDPHWRTKSSWRRVWSSNASRVFAFCRRQGTVSWRAREVLISL